MLNSIRNEMGDLMVDYRVVPDALRANVKKLYEVADRWNASKATLSGQNMAPDDLGFFGKPVPPSYNSSLTTVERKLMEGFEALSNAAETLKKVADDYDSREAEYYRQFGYLEGSC